MLQWSSDVINATLSRLGIYIRWILIPCDMVHVIEAAVVAELEYSISQHAPH